MMNHGSRALLASVAFVMFAGSPTRGAGELPEGYALVKETKAGRAMSTEKRDATKVADVLGAALDDLDDYFDGDYDVTNSVEDQRDHRSGFATIAGKSKGDRMKGVVMARLRDRGAVVVVVIGRADASAGDWAELTSPPANKEAANGGAGGDAPAGDPGVPAPAVAPLPLREYRFPDGTGSVGLAEGWRTDAQSCQTSFEIVGPADQRVTFGMSHVFNTPDSIAVAMARQYGTGGVPMFVAPFCEPVDAINAFVPQLDRVSRQAGGPAVEVDRVTKVLDMKPLSQGSHWAVVTYGATITKDGQRKHYQTIAQAGTTPITADAWSLYTTVGMAPDATAKADFPVMIAMINSWRTNDAALQAKTNAWVADRNAWFQGQQQAHRTVTDAHDAQNANWHKTQAAQSRTAADFSETIRGYRDVEDTTTGQRKPVDLGNVDDIVNQLNERDPGRYKQIPLRDQ